MHTGGSLYQGKMSTSEKWPCSFAVYPFDIFSRRGQSRATTTLSTFWSCSTLRRQICRFIVIFHNLPSQPRVRSCPWSLTRRLTSRPGSLRHGCPAFLCAASSSWPGWRGGGGVTGMAEETTRHVIHVAPITLIILSR